jgi:hypothetical protein
MRIRGDKKMDFEEILLDINVIKKIFIKSLFEANGVTFFFDDEYSSGLNPSGPPSRLLVLKKDVDIARKVLKEADLL